MKVQVNHGQGHSTIIEVPVPKKELNEIIDMRSIVEEYLKGKYKWISYKILN